MKKQDVINSIIRLVAERGEDGELSFEATEAAVILKPDRFTGSRDVRLSHISVMDDDMTIIGVIGHGREPVFYGTENLTVPVLKEIARFIKKTFPVKKPTINATKAERLLFEILAKEGIEDAVDNFAESLFQKCIDAVEAENNVCNEDGSGHEWYDEAHDEFRETVFKRLKGFFCS